jgi:hypothetical protein
MDPIVVCGPLQRLPGVDRPVQFLLLLAEKIGRLLRLLALGSLSFLFLLRFLLVRRDLRRFDEVVWRVLNWT